LYNSLTGQVLTQDPVYSTVALSASGTAKFSIGCVLQPGTYSIEASYSGDMNYSSSSSSPLTVTVSD
jgi:hypothetical protein